MHSRMGAAIGALAVVILAGCSGQPQSSITPGSQSLMPSLQSQHALGGRAHASSLGTESVLYSFQGCGAAIPDGAQPYAGLKYVNGTLYGTTKLGSSSSCPGSSGAGTVFAITPSGAYNLLYSFTGYPSSGVYPLGSLAASNPAKGVLYGTTFYGGDNPAYCLNTATGCGSVFKLTSSGAYTQLHSFPAVGSMTDGANPTAGLTNVNGTFYGTTTNGGGTGCGSIGCGTIFKISPSGTYTQLYIFAGGNDGYYPQSRLTNVGGTLYGTTYGGGTHDQGTVFSITPSGAYSQLYAFGNNPLDGYSPVGGMTQIGSVLYGTTSGGGAGGWGTVFRLTTSGVEKVLYSFTGGYSDGCGPLGDLTTIGRSKTLYGTTFGPGKSGCHSSTIFSITTAGTYNVLYVFGTNPGDGSNPAAGLTNVGGTLYGTATAGGAYGEGTVYSFTPSEVPVK